MNDRERTAPMPGGPPRKEAPQPSGRVVLTPPTAEQEDYLREIERSTGSFDPNVVVGGPRHNRA
jgi:hypothetical protein